MDAPLPILRLMQACIVENSDEAWRDLMERLTGQIHIRFARVTRTDQFNSFCTWLPGWLYYGRKIHAAYRSLAKDEPTANEEQLERSFRSYFDRVIDSGIAEFLREQNDLARSQPEEQLAQAEVRFANEAIDSLEPRVIRAVASLAIGLRVPLCLRFYPAIELTDEDFAWISERSGWEKEAVVAALEAARQEHPGRKYPIDSKLIGRITGHSADANGKYSAVDQAIKRALKKLREHLGEARIG